VATLQNCNVCRGDFALTPEFWYRERKAKSGLSGTCKRCANERARKWKEANPDRYRDNYLRNGRARSAESRRAEYERNRERILEWHREYYERNAEAIRQYQREYIAANADAVKQRKKREYEAADPEVRRSKGRAFRAANAERLRATSAEYYAQNADRRKQYQREYKAANPEKVAERNRLYRLTHREQINAKSREWKAANPERVRALVAKYKARRREAPGIITAADIRGQYDAQRGTCFYCSLSLADCLFHVDHHIPLSRGGTNEPDNIVLACPACNMAKGTKLPHEFQRRKE
jgi:5-methylcytosine-specific restriction endonuclease McrA